MLIQFRAEFLETISSLFDNLCFLVKFPRGRLSDGLKVTIISWWLFVSIACVRWRHESNDHVAWRALFIILFLPLSPVLCCLLTKRAKGEVSSSFLLTNCSCVEHDVFLLVLTRSLMTTLYQRHECDRWRHDSRVLLNAAKWAKLISFVHEKMWKLNSRGKTMRLLKVTSS